MLNEINSHLSGQYNRVKNKMRVLFTESINIYVVTKDRAALK